MRDNLKIYLKILIVHSGEKSSYAWRVNEVEIYEHAQLNIHTKTM